MNALYRVKDWGDLYENNRTRDLKTMSWVPMPNKQDGDGYTVLVDHKDGAQHLGAWLAIVQVASKCDPRGTLMRGNRTPHTAATLSRMTRLPERVIAAAIERLVDAEIGWLEVVDAETLETIPQESAAAPQDDAQKGRKGRKGKQFVIPSPNEVETYAKEIGYPIDGQAWCDAYAQKDWMVGKNKMKDWKAAVRNWKANGWHPSAKKPGGSPRQEDLI